MFIALIVLAVLFLSVWAYLNFNPQFGKKPSKEELEKLSKSSQWNGKVFENQIETNMDMGLKNIPGLLKKQLFDREGRSPKQPIPVIPFDAEQWNVDNKPKFVWYGHSVLLLKLNGKNILIDPMLGSNAAPVAPFAVKRFSEHTLDIIDTLPDLDAILFTHDHYDHLDLESIKRLKSKTNKWLVALGVKRHLVKWHIPAAQIQEFDWWNTTHLEDIELTFTPSQHFSGRGLSDRAKSLWGGWAFKTDDFNIYWSGDGGEGPHFKAIGEKLGPFDWAFMENGQYNELWHTIHMYPEEAIPEGINAKAKVMTPVHWAGFPLALHHWKDPIERFQAEAERTDQKLACPRIGQIVDMTKPFEQENWWEELE